MTTEIKFSDSLSVATTFATKLLAGTLNHYVDWDNSTQLVEITRNETWFSTDIISRLRITTSDMEISKLVASDVIDNPKSMGVEGRIRSVTLFAFTKSGEEIEVATFDVKQDYLDGDRATGWTAWHVTNVVVSVTDQDVQLVTEDYSEGCYLADKIWGRQVYPY